jgi:glycosyltransferase involved in cell wall biosynthesis
VIPLHILHFARAGAGSAADGVRILAAWQIAQGHQVAVSPPQREAAADLPAGVTVLAHPRGFFAGLGGARAAFARSAVMWTPDVIHVHDLDLLQAALDLARRLQLPLVANVSGRDDAHAARRLRDRSIDWVLVPSESHRAHYQTRVGIDRDRLAVLPPGVDVGAAGATPYRLPDGTTVVGFTGSFKRNLPAIADLVDALGIVAREAPVRGIYLPALPGDRQAMGEFFARAAKPGLITIARESTVDFMGDIDVFAAPGSDDRIGTTALAAMASARPLLAVAVGGTPELVRDGDNAVLVPKRSAQAFADGLRQLRDPARRRQLGESARALAASLYDIGLVGKAAVELYRTAIGGGNATAAAESSTAYRRITEMRS